MLKINPSERISATEALKHPYFADLPETLSSIYQKIDKS